MARSRGEKSKEFTHYASVSVRVERVVDGISISARVGGVGRPRRESELRLAEHEPDYGGSIEEAAVLEDAVRHVGRDVLEEDVDVADEDAEEINAGAEAAEEEGESEEDPGEIGRSEQKGKRVRFKEGRRTLTPTLT